MQEVITGRREKDITPEWIDKEELRRKIKPNAQKHVETFILGI